MDKNTAKFIGNERVHFNKIKHLQARGLIERLRKGGKT